MTQVPVPICIAGAPGLIGKRHTKHVLEEPQARLSCIVDPTPVGAAYAAELGVPLYTSLGDVLAAKAKGEVEVAGIILATPNATHVPLGIECLKAGVNVLVEKPMSVDIPSGRELIAAEKESKAKILVGQHRRFNTYMGILKQKLQDGELGQVLAVHGTWASLKPQNYFEGPTAWRKEGKAGGPILINLVHEIDGLRFLLGDVTKVYCEEGLKTRGHEVEETGAITLRFESGAVGTFIFSDAATSPYNFEGATNENPTLPYSGQNCYTILGTKGSASLPELKTWHYDSPEGCWTDPLKVGEAKEFVDVPAFTSQLKNFVSVCRGEAEPNCSGEDALGTIITLEAVKESIRTGLPVKVAKV